MPRLELVDTHCHLDMMPDVAGALARAQAAGVTRCLTIGTSLEASRATIAIAASSPSLRAAVGVHPHDADTVTDEALAAIDQLAAASEVVAIGEVGLDYYRNLASRDGQHRALQSFARLAQRRRLPLLIHCRDAYEDLLPVLRRAWDGPLAGVIHCASGPPAFIRDAVEAGFHVSFSGTVTFPNAAAVRALVPLVPDDRLLVETDAPFLAPQPVRGQPNEPAHVRYTAECVAGLRGTTLDALAALTTRNARTLFKW